MRLLYTSKLCIWDNSTLVILCFYGDLMRIFYVIKNMLQFITIALPLELEAFQVVSLVAMKNGFLKGCWPIVGVDEWFLK
jgi:hypothetical protein